MAEDEYQYDRYDDGRCDDCMCCTRAGCHRGPGSGCPIGYEGGPFDGEYLCPCTGE